MNSKTVSGIYQTPIQAKSVLELLVWSGVSRADIALRDEANSELERSRGVGLVIFVSDSETEDKTKQILLNTGAREISSQNGNPDWSERVARSEFPWNESDEELRYRV